MIILEELKQGKLKLFIPEVVQEEVINQFRQGLDLFSVKKYRDKFAILIASDLKINHW